MHCATWGLVVQMAVVLLLPSALERERKEEPTLFAKTLGLVRASTRWVRVAEESTVFCREVERGFQECVNL